MNYDIDAELGFQSDSSEMMNSLPISQTYHGSIWVPLEMRVPSYPQVFTPSKADILLFVLSMGS